MGKTKDEYDKEIFREAEKVGAQWKEKLHVAYVPKPAPSPSPPASAVALSAASLGAMTSKVTSDSQPKSNRSKRPNRRGHPLLVRFESPLMDRLRRVAKERGLTMSALVRDAVLRYLDEHEQRRTSEKFR